MTAPPESPAAVARREGVRLRRVLVAGEFQADSFGSHIAETLEAMGCPAARYPMRLQQDVSGGVLRHRISMARNLLDATLMDRLPSVRERRLRRLIAAAHRFRADTVVFTYDYLFPGEVAALKAKTGAEVALWYPDHIANLGRMACVVAPFDALFFKDPFMVHALRDLARGTVHYLPEAYNPARHRLPETPFDRAPYVCDVTTAGNLHAARYAVFSRLTEFDCKLWGNPAPWWLDAGPVAAMQQGKYVVNEEKAVAFTSARALVNTLFPAEAWGLNVRAFEAAGVGAFQLLDWRPGLGQLFEDGREVVSFRGIEDLKEKLRHYLPRPEARAAIARAGQARAQRDHTYALRLALLLRTLEGAAAGFPLPPAGHAER